LAWCNFFKNRVNQPENIFHLESIVDVVNNIENKQFSFPNDIDVVTGGFPCQDFSFAGKRKGFDSHKDHNGIIYNEPTEATRGQLYLWLKKVVEITKPKVFIAENVKGLVTLGDVKDIIQKDFRNIDDGYVVLDAQVLNAKNYGVAQNRERVIFIGISKRYANKKILDELISLQENLKSIHIHHILMVLIQS
jgi:DNA (cytosine-5)-methyltransferase 1